MMSRRARTLIAPLAAAVVAAAALTSCGSDGPSSPSPGSPVGVTPTPAPTPTPVPLPPVQSSSCPLGPGTAETSCSSRSSLHMPEVNGAVDRVVLARPELFDLADENGEGTGQYRVHDRDAYLQAVLSELRAVGLCAQLDFDDETVQVKDSNDLSEDFEVFASHYVRRNGFITACEPAAFPVEPAEIIARVRVGFWMFYCDAGVTPPLNNDRKLPLGCEGAVTATPKDREDRDVPIEVHGPDIEWTLRRGAEVVEVLPDDVYPNPFNTILNPLGPIDAFQLCATVQGVEGCLSGDTIR